MPERLAAAIIPYRIRGAALEVFLVLRSPRLDFLGGYLAFPGGAVDESDADVPLHPSVPVEDGNFKAMERSFYGCAARELFEETGLLVTSPKAGRAPSSEQLLRLRHSLCHREKDPAPLLGPFLVDHGMSIDTSRLRRAARLITPRFSTVRFDTTFYWTEVRGEPEVLPGELVSGAWWSPDQVLEEWRHGKCRIAPPVTAILEILSAKGLDGALQELQAMPPRYEDSGRAIRAAPGYDFVPLATPPLRPEIPTNTFLIGATQFVVVDAAPRREKGRQHLFKVIDTRLAAGDRFQALVLTHHHQDHVGALEEVSGRYGVPVWGHPRTAELLARKFDRLLLDGDEIALGRGPDGREGWSLRALFTPGHAQGHLALYDERTASLVAGDLLSTLVSMYVGSPGGNLQDYFASLARVRALPLQTLYPSHGRPTHEPVKLIEDTIQHRRERIEEVKSLLTDSPRDTTAIALEIYADTARRLRPMIVRATRAALEHLVGEGRAERRGEDSFVSG
jgi:glyoxylase-like metal-dependent hydrolase (beta-lactamase superfamily II)/8-oxo-dGTP pyrophosphatase MutT (NUDIX family)